jgi:hypothetical protein
VARRRPLHQQRGNDLHLRWLDSSSDGPRASATTGRPSFTSPHGGREPAIKAKEPEARSAGGTNGLVSGGNRFSRSSLTYGDHHLSTDDSSHLPTNTAPASGGCPKAHRQVLTPVLATRTRTGPSKNTSTGLAAYDVLCRRQRREDLDVAGPRAARPSLGWGTNSCTLARQQQFAFPAWLEDASFAELEDAFLLRMPEEEAGRRPTQRQALTRPALRHSEDDEDP